MGEDENAGSGLRITKAGDRVGTHQPHYAVWHRIGKLFGPAVDPDQSHRQGSQRVRYSLSDMSGTKQIYAGQCLTLILLKTVDTL